jgi:hypothetical protein
MNSAFANKRKKEDRPAGDLYHTPKSLVWVAEDIIHEEFKQKDILEPCCGSGAISEELAKMGYRVTVNDINGVGRGFDYTIPSPLWDYENIITNPPFSMWDDFVFIAKYHCRKFMFIGRLNYFGTYARSQSNLWPHLKYVLPFNRYVDYQTPFRSDGLFHVGSQATAWFLWDMDYAWKPQIEVIDVQKYAKLGAFKKTT